MELSNPNENLKIVYNTIHGRGVFTNQELTVGTIIHSFTPKIRSIKASPSETGKDSCLNTCQYCLKAHVDESPPTKFVTPSSNILEIDKNERIGCDFCKIHTYCSYSCYIRDWHKIHKLECRIFKSLLSITSGNEVLADLQVRLIVRMYVCCQLEQALEKKMLSLVSHSDIYNEDRGGRQMLEHFSRDIVDAIQNSIKYSDVGTTENNHESLVSNECSKSTPKSLKSYIDKLVCISLINSNIFLNSFSEYFGAMIDPDFSLINHSCLSNTFYLQTANDSFVLISNGNIKKNSEVTITYTIPSLPKFIRRPYLSQKFYFDCNCKLCSKELDFYFSYNCYKCKSALCSIELGKFFAPSKEGFHFKNPEKCTSCSQPINYEILAHAKQIHQKIFAIVIQEFTSFTCSDTHCDDEQLEQSIGELAEEELTELLLELYGKSLPLNHRSYTLLNNLVLKLNNVEVKNTIPLFCFPINLVVHSLSYYHLEESPKLMLADLMECLQWNVKLCFEVDIPSVLCESQLPLVSLLNSLGATLLKFTERVCFLKKSTGQDSATTPLNIFKDTVWGSYEDGEVVSILIKSSYCILLKAFEIYEPVSSLNSQLSDKFTESLKSYRDVINLFNIPDLKNWFTMSDAGLNQLHRTSALHDLFKLVDMKNFHSKKGGKLYLQHADRNFYLF